MRDENTKQKTFSRRAFVVCSIKGLLFSLVAGRYWYLQVIKSEKFGTLSEKNRIKLTVVVPPRGSIFCRLKDAIATNIPSYAIGVDPTEIKNVHKIIEELNQTLSLGIALDEKDIQKLLNKKQSSDPLFLKHNLSWKEIALFCEHEHLLRGVDLFRISAREYSHPEAFAHITGYVSIPNREELRDLNIPASSQIKVGKMGIEKIFDTELRGEPGFKKNEVDARGKLIRTLQPEIVLPGQDIYLTIDFGLQCFIHELLSVRNLVASAIVMEIRTGKVLALHSTPSYNPEQFSVGISTQDWEELINSEYNPLINHTIASVYPPGSTFKLVTAFSALLQGFDPNTKYNCTGSFTLGKHSFRCWNHSGHGAIDMKTAIAQSCNPYFFNAALKTGIEELCSGGRMLGLGCKSGIELYGESAGLMPSPDWKRRRFNLPWYQGDTVNASIGQGYTLMTPIQIAVMTSRIASGWNVSPTLTGVSQCEPLDAEQNATEAIKTGMFECINSPKGLLFGKGLFDPRLRVCGKTGTAQVAALKYKNKSKSLRHHGLFTSFAPFDDPKYTVTVVVEHAQAGANVAPIAAEIHKYMHEKGFYSIS